MSSSNPKLIKLTPEEITMSSENEENKEEEGEESYPEIGDRRDGLILVCRGDDRPDEWINWLEPLIDDFEEQQRIAEEHTITLDAGPDYGTMGDWRDFCDALGISIDSEFWKVA